MRGRVAPEVKSRLYENKEVRYNDPSLPPIGITFVFRS